MLAAFERFAHAHLAYDGCDNGALASASESLLRIVFDHLPQAVILADSMGQVVFANREARMIGAAGNGLRLGPGGLRAETVEQTKALRALIDAAAGAQSANPGGAALALSRRSGRALSLVVSPLPSARGMSACLDSEPHVLILVVDPDRALPLSAEQLRQLYGFTPAEAQVAIAAVRGRGLPAIAAELDIALTTAKTHLQRVFEKTGTRRQAELVRLILASGSGLHLANAGPVLASPAGSYIAD